VRDLDDLLKALSDSANRSLADAVDALGAAGISLSRLPVDDRCDDDFDHKGVWSWAEPMAEHHNRPRYVLVGKTLHDLRVCDISQLAENDPLRHQVWLADELDRAS
jgi:hypothetical protein